MVAFTGVTDVSGGVAAAEAALREAGLVGGSHDPDAVLAGRGTLILRPGPKAAEATAYGDTLLDMRTNGVAFMAERYFNAYALGFAEGFDCPVCGGTTTDGDDQFGDQMDHIGRAAVEWCDGVNGATAQCVLCDAAPRVTDWTLEDPVFLADIAIEFWNWPHLDPDPVARKQWWHVDVVPMLEDAVGAPARLSGHKI